MPVVKDIDLKRILGKWYEIIRIPKRAGEGCKSATLKYTAKLHGRIRIEHKYVYIDGRTEVVVGEAKAFDGCKIHNGHLKPGKLSACSYKPFYHDYFVIELDEDYQYAMIGDRRRERLLIISRDPTTKQSILSELIERAEELGFQVPHFVSEFFDSYPGFRDRPRTVNDFG